MVPRSNTLRIAGACLALGLAIGGCVDEPGAPTPDIDEAELATGHLGHVHVIVQPRRDAFDPAPALRVEARFAEFRGLGEPAARVWANVPRDPSVGLSVGECAPTGRLSDPAGETDDDRELTLLDGGDLRVSVGSHDVVVPLALVPDLLPWVSGVEYLHVGDHLPEISSAPDGVTPVTLHLDGSPDDELEALDVSLELPGRFELLPAVEFSTEGADDGALILRWEPPGESTDVLVLQLSAHGEVATIGEDVTCVAWDSGEVRLDMVELHDAGLADADMIRVTARRIVQTTVSAGAFSNVDVVVELRDQRFVPSP